LPAPGWSLEGIAQPTSFSPADGCFPKEFVGNYGTGECDHYTLLATNSGALPSPPLEPSVVSLEVPAGLEIEPAKLEAKVVATEEPLTCSVAGRTVECTYEGELPPEGKLQLRAPVEVEAGTLAGPLSDARAAVTGGGAAPVSLVVATTVDSPQAFGVAKLSFGPHAPDGSLDAQAGGHPHGLDTGFQLNSVLHVYGPGPGQGFGGPAPVEDPKDALVQLPLGLVGNPTVLPQCPLATLRFSVQTTTSCPVASRIGNVVLYLESEVGSSLHEADEVTPLFNLTPEAGYPAEFGFAFHHKIVLLYAALVHVGGPGGGYALRVGTPGIPAVGGNGLAYRVSGVSLAFFGDPAAINGGAIASGAFLTNPSDCTGGPLRGRIEANSWQNPGRWIDSETVVYPQMSGCEALQFHPTIAVRPEVHAADTPSGYEVRVDVPQSPNVAPSLATPDLRDARVTLPSGVVLSASAANGLAACDATGPQGINIGSDQIAPAGQDLGDPEATELGAGHPGGNSSPYDDGLYHVAPGKCPAASQIGTVEVTTPLLAEPLEGHIFLARPECGGPGGSACTDADAADGRLYGIYLEVSGSGVIVKLRGRVSADPTTGQLTGTFTENPQLPFESFRLRFDGGKLAPLANPQFCGPSYRTTSTFTPWSSPYTADATPTSSFAVSADPGGSGCVSSETQSPNAPSFEGGTGNPLAGAYSPFVLKVSREDGSQRLRSLNVNLPDGLLARLAGTPYCPDSAIASAAGRSGAAEQANPSCPKASEVGTVVVGAGPGSSPYYAQGHAFLAGPYKDAPLSLAIITPAVAGPFDLGTVVVRTALYVNQETAQVTARSDPFPTMLDGTPLDIRSVALTLDRSQFTLNPTNCEEMSLSAEAVSTTGSVADLRNAFQVVGCKGLAFKPNLKIQLKGATKRVGHPALKAVLTAKLGEANIGRAQVNLPRGEFLDQGNLNKTCTKPVLLAGNCPKSSVYGRAKAWTPLLEKPLEGYVYLVGGYGYKLPALVADLNGQIRFTLVGKVDSGKNKGIRNTFELVPDAPVSRFVLEMKGGKKYGLFENTENLCKAKKARRRAIVRFTGQNGKVDQYKPVVTNQCGKAKEENHASRKRARNKEDGRTR
jgi:hypothetical protein